MTRLSDLAHQIEVLEEELPADLGTRRWFSRGGLTTRVMTFKVEATGPWGSMPNKTPVQMFGAHTKPGAEILIALIEHRVSCNDGHKHLPFWTEFERAVRERLDQLARQLQRGASEYVRPHITIVHQQEDGSTMPAEQKLLEAGE